MTKQEKLILLLIALIVIGRFSVFARDIYLARTYASLIPLEVENYWKNVSLIFGLVENFGAAIWLYIESKALNLKAWVWSLLGLFFGVVGVILFYVIQIYSLKQINRT